MVEVSPAATSTLVPHSLVLKGPSHRASPSLLSSYDIWVVVTSPGRKLSARFEQWSTEARGMHAVLERTTPNTLADSEGLAKRERTRLWYRTGHDEDPQDRVIAEQTSAPETASVGQQASGSRKERTGPLRSMETLQSALEKADTDSAPKAQSGEIKALTDWRDAPRHCPILLLSANQILDARVPGPLLGPGTKYRIVTVTDGVVCLQVEALDGQVGLGYCNAVDLMCYEPDIMYLRGEKRSGRRYTARLNLSRISHRISGVTGSLIG
jgi:hypothetical protein